VPTRELRIQSKSLRLLESPSGFELHDGAESLAVGSASVTPVGRGLWSVLWNGESHLVRRSGDAWLVNGVAVEVEVVDPRAASTRSVSGGPEGRQTLKAVMPGKVVRVLCKAGDAVEAGQGIVVLEAMKMQNEVKSPKAGTVSSVAVKEGSAVSAGDLLAVIE
jgi:biotin carboxyl carrier protein